jgi:hypothetical protein
VNGGGRWGRFTLRLMLAITFFVGTSAYAVNSAVAPDDEEGISETVAAPSAAAASNPTAGDVVEEGSRQRITSIYLSQTFLNEQLKTYVTSPSIRELKLELDPKERKILLRGLYQIPTDELRAVNLDPKLGAFRFQMTIKVKATRKGFVILVFPLNETYFYPASSPTPDRDRVIVPVQLLSLALASARGYFAALSGDFSSIDREEAKYKALLAANNKAIRDEKNPDARDAMENERDSLKLKLASVPIERKKMKLLSKKLGGAMGFTGEKDINLNEEFVSRRNAIIFKLNLQRFTPYLQGIDLGGIRIVHDSHDGEKGENYFSIDINARGGVAVGQAYGVKLPDDSDEGDGLVHAPAAMVRINQALFESKMVIEAQRKAVSEKVSELKMELKNDGLHVSGKYKMVIFKVPFDTIVDLDSEETPLDVFDITVRGIKVAGFNLDFLTSYILETMKERLDATLKGMCKFEYIGTQRKDHSQALRVTMDPKKLIPALPNLHVLNVDVRDREFLFKVGHQ